MTARDSRTWIVDPLQTRAATMGLLPGIRFFKARMTKDGPWVAVKSEVIEDRDEAGDLMADVVYRLTVNGEEVPDYYEGRFAGGLVGEEITEADYRYVLADLAYGELEMGIRKDQPVDLRTIPAILPPGA